MIVEKPFLYVPNENENERVSNGYLLSLIALMAGPPLPIVNLIASLIFYLGNKSSSYFVRWHCTQILLSQFSLLLLNSIVFWWTIAIIFNESSFTIDYFAYITFVLILNLEELFLTIYSAVKIRKGVHVKWWLFGSLANVLCKKSGAPFKISGQQYDKKYRKDSRKTG